MKNGSYLRLKADIELRTTIIKCWPHTKREKIDLLVPTPKS
jgi:hypothetical protein